MIDWVTTLENRPNGRTLVKEGYGDGFVYQIIRSAERKYSLHIIDPSDEEASTLLAADLDSLPLAIEAAQQDHARSLGY